MNRIILISFIFMATSVATAQTVQKGVVKEYNEKDRKTPLAGVELDIRNTNSTISEKDGTFTLTFQTQKAGSRVKMRRAYKTGYELFNKDAVKQWNINPDEPFDIVMCRSDRFKDICDNYYSKASANYEKQLNKQLSDIEKLKADGKLKEEEYQKRLDEVQEAHDKQLDNLDFYIDRFARIDLSELRAEERVIIELLQDGLFDEAIAKYKDLNLMEKYRQVLDQDKKEVDAIERLHKENTITKNEKKETFSSIKRNVETLELVGGKENIAKAIAMLREVVQMDSLNVELILLTGDYHKNYVADLPAAMSYYRKALDVSKILYGESHPLTCKSITCIGEIYIVNKEFPVALEYFNEAMHQWEVNGELDHPDAAQLYNDFGVTLRSMGDNAIALEYYKKALPIWEESMGPENVYVATLLNNIGTAYRELGDYSTALEYYQKSLDMSVKVRSPRHPTVGMIYNNMGMLSYYLGDLSQAVEYSLKSLDILEESMSSDNPYISMLSDNIAFYYNSLGDYSKALELYDKSLESKLKKFGEDNLNIALSYSHIGSTYDDMEDYSKAADYLNRALRIQERHLNPDDHDIAVSLIKLGSVYCALGEYEKSLDNYSRGIEISMRAKGDDNTEIGIAYNNMAATYKGLGDFYKAFECYDKALKIYRNNLGDDSLEVAKTYNNIGKTYSQLENYKKALEYFDKALSICQKKGLDEESPYFLAIRKNKTEVESKMKEK